MTQDLKSEDIEEIRKIHILKNELVGKIIIKVIKKRNTDIKSLKIIYDRKELGIVITKNSRW